MKTFKLTLDDLYQWVLNDEGLYLWCRSEMGSTDAGKVRAFVKKNRPELERLVNAVLNRPPAR